MTPPAAVTATTRHAIIGDQLAIVSIAQGFLPSAVLFALIDVGVFRVLGDQAAPVSEIASATSSQESRLERLLDAGVMLGVLDVDADGLYSIPGRFRGMLTDHDDAAYLGDWLEFMRSWYEPFASLGARVRDSEGIDMYGADREAIRRNTLAMHGFASLRGTELLDHVDLSACSSMLDAGCGPGTYSFQLGMRYPQIELNLLDRGPVLDVAREVMQRYNLQNPVKVIDADNGSRNPHSTYDFILV
jgi:hypothetical protein